MGINTNVTIGMDEGFGIEKGPITAGLVQMPQKLPENFR